VTTSKIASPGESGAAGFDFRGAAALPRRFRGASAIGLIVKKR